MDSENQILAQLPPDWETAPSARATELLPQLARAQALQGVLPKARAALDRTTQILTELKEKPDPKIEVRLLLEQGRVLCLSMSPSKAHDFFTRAWTLANETKLDFFAVDAALMLSTIRPPKFQNEWLQKAFAIANASSDPQVRLWLSQLLFLEGWHAFDFRQFERALKCFEDALAQPKATEEAWKQMAIQWSCGRTMRALGQVDQAMAVQQGLLKEMSLSGNISGHVYLEIAECQQQMKQTELAKANFELAYGILSVPSWYADNRIDELNRMKYLFKKR